MTTAVRARHPRIDSVDLVRGIVMVVMMLDHTRDFVNAQAFQFDPTDLSKTTTAIFLSRWITHFCAPVFVFLAGTAVALQAQRGKSPRELSRFLVTRGLWLVFLELTVIRAVMWFSLDPSYLATLQVIWVIGVAMILLAGLIHLPKWAIATFGGVLVAGHNLLDHVGVPPWAGPGKPSPSVLGKLWMVLHQGGLFPITSPTSPTVFPLYALIPWIGVLPLGYVFGQIYTWEPDRRRRFLLRAGWLSIVAFVVIRATNVYGDPRSWQVQHSVWFTVLSFVNTNKYPPSLLYLLMTLGPAMLALAAFERPTASVTPAKGGVRVQAVRTIFITYGRVPLFFYVLQWLTAHGFAVLASLAAHKSSITYLVSSPPAAFQAPPDAGFSIYVTWVVWLTGVALLYPLCKWFAGVKARRRDWWLSYL